MFFKLAVKSLLNRKGSVVLTLMAMTVSIFVLLAVEHIRHQAKASFTNTVSGVDLIVGARTGSLNLLLYSVFRIGSPTNNIAWRSFETIASNKQVKWAIPITLGDSHKGYRVMGTTQDYFKFFSYGNKHKLNFSNGEAFEGLFDVVLGADVAKQLGYTLGDKIVLSHGIAATSFSRHDDKPFTIVGILSPTGTPVDQTLHVSLEGIEAIHINWQQGVKIPGANTSIEESKLSELQPTSITAFMLGLKSRIATFHVQRQINNYPQEPMLAILPGVALSELWQMMGLLEKILLCIAILVFIAALLGLSAMLLSSIRDRKHEIQLLRIVGAPSYFLFFLIELEALLITSLSIALAVCFLAISLVTAENFFTQLGLHISYNIFSKSTLYFLAIIIVTQTVAAAIPALSAFARARHA